MTELLMKDGDYVPDGFGGFERKSGTEGLLARCLFRLGCRRGAFVWLPELGSRFFELGREKPSARRGAAKQFAMQALEGLPVQVEDVLMRAIGDRAELQVILRTADGTTGLEVTV